MKVQISIVIIVITVIFGGFIFYQSVIHNSLKPGECLIEINKRYVASASKGKYYRIEKTNYSNYVVSTYHNKAWLLLKNKDKDYFDNNDIFQYELTPCPDTRSEMNQGIDQRVKHINFKR